MTTGTMQEQIEDARDEVRWAQKRLERLQIEKEALAEFADVKRPFWRNLFMLKRSAGEEALITANRGIRFYREMLEESQARLNALESYSDRRGT